MAFAALAGSILAVACGTSSPAAGDAGPDAAGDARTDDATQAPSTMPDGGAAPDSDVGAVGDDAATAPDASGPADAGGGESSVFDAEAESDGGADAAPDTSSDAADGADAPSYPYPLNRCSASRDVFYVDVQGAQGPIQLGEQTYTNLGANFFVSLQPQLSVMVETGGGSAGSIDVWTPHSAPPVPGTYPQGPSNTGTTIDVVVGDEGCYVTSGSFTLVDLQYSWPDGSSVGDVSSLLLSFDLVCGSNTLRGCVRYSP